MNNFQSKVQQFFNMSVKPYNPNSRSSQMQKGFISPELKVARFFGAVLFDYDYSQNETDNILTYQINIQNNEDLIYINYRLKDLYNTWISGTLKNNYIFLSIYKGNTDNMPKTIYYFLANNLYDINNQMIRIDLNYLYYLNTPCILTINVVSINDYTSCLEDDNWVKQRLLLETNLIDYLYNELYSKDNQNIVNLEYHPRKNIFTFVENYKIYNILTKYYKMLKYYIFRLNYSYNNGK